MEADKKKRKQFWTSLAAFAIGYLTIQLIPEGAWDSMMGVVTGQGASYALKKKGIDLTEAEVKGEKGAHLLAGVCSIGDMEAVRLLVEAGAPVNSTYGTISPLSQACSAGHLEIVRYLLRHGADPDYRIVLDPEGLPDDVRRKVEAAGVKAGEYYYALHIAAEMWRPDIVKELLDAGATPDLPNSTPMTPLMSAIPGIELLRAISQEAGMESRHLDKRMRELGQQDPAPRREVVKLLISRMDNLDQRDDNGATALMYAAAIGDAVLVQMLLDAGADKNLKDKDGDTALEYASNQECARLLQPSR